MVRPFEFLDEFGDLVAITDPEGERRHHEPLFLLWIIAGDQPLPQQPVHRSFERIAASPDLVLNQPGNIIVNGKSSAHIMMLERKAS